jgi:hypothetical protein
MGPVTMMRSCKASWPPMWRIGEGKHKQPSSYVAMLVGTTQARFGHCPRAASLRILILMGAAKGILPLNSIVPRLIELVGQTTYSHA